MFENPEIALQELPDTDSVQWQALDPGYKKLRRLQNSIAVLLTTAPIVILPLALRIPLLATIIFWLVWIMFATALLVWPGIALPKRGYVLRDKDILFRKGVVWQSVTAIPFNRIQHVETSSTPFDRKFGLATLQLFTAGGSGGDLKIEGLAAETAEQMRLYVLKQAGASIETS